MHKKGSRDKVGRGGSGQKENILYMNMGTVHKFKSSEKDREKNC